MKREPRWIEKKALLLLHEESLATFGGARGLRDDGLLDSALARPRHVHAYVPSSTLADLAAAYADGLARNHPFVDGNKRAAYLAMRVFLALNGLVLEAKPAEKIQAMVMLAQGELDGPALASWIRQRTHKLS